MTRTYAGLDVSDKTTHVCVVDEAGTIVWRGACATDPEALAATLKRRCADVVRVVLETGPLSAFLYHGLIERGLPAICVCARHAKGVLSTRANKSDPHDAEGLAQLARTGWFKAVRIKQEGTHMARAQLEIHAQLHASRRVLANQLRGLLKLFGLRLGKVTTPGKLRERLEVLFAQKPELKPILQPLIDGIEALDPLIRQSKRRLAAFAAADPVAVRLMSVPGVGPIVALTYKCSIEDPTRFARGEDAGAYAGLVPRRNQSGERDYRRGRTASRPEDAMTLVDRLEQLAVAGDVLRRAEEQVAGRVQRIVEHRGKSVLQLGVKIDQKISVGNQVELGIGWILGKVVGREDAHVAHLFVQTPASPFLSEKALQSLRRHFVRNFLTVHCGPCDPERALVDVGGEDLHLGRDAQGRHVFAHQNRKAEGLLAGGAAGDPDADVAVCALALEQLGDDLSRQRVEGVRVPEELGDADQQLVEQVLQFGGRFAAMGDEGVRVVDLQRQHAPADAAAEGLALVVLEIVADLAAQQLAKRFGLAVVHTLAAIGCRAERRGVVGQPIGHVRHRQDRVDAAGLDGVPGHIDRHRPVLVTALGEDEAAVFMDRADAARTVVAVARQHHRHRPRSQGFGQRREELVDRIARALLSKADELQGVVLEGEHRAGENDMNRVRAHRLAPHGLDHRYFGEPRQHFRQVAFVVRGQMQDQHEAHAAIGRQLFKKALQSVDSPRGRADRHDGE